LPFKGPVQIPLIIVDVLEIPLQGAGVGIERERGVGKEAVTADSWFARRVAQRAGVVGVTRAEERQVELRIVAAGCPDGGAFALLGRQTVPGVASSLPGARDGVEAPNLLAGLTVERDDVVAARGAAGETLHHLALRHERPTGQDKARPGLNERVIPDDMARFYVEGDLV